MTAPEEQARSLAIIGGGPRAVGVLERLAANAPELGAGPLVVHVVDPFPIGPGRIWRYEQSPLLKLNSRAADVTMFTDASSTIEGPVRPGPSLIEWAEAVRAGEVVLDVGDPAVRCEIEGLRAESFPTRRLQCLYLRWFYREVVAALGPDVEIREHRARATEVLGCAEGAQVIVLDSGDRLTADLVLFALGRSGALPTEEQACLAAFAARHSLDYLPPSSTADADLSALTAGRDVIVRGFGLVAVDLVVLLTEGRGGRFTRDRAGVLRYLPSGREPRITIGSRRGVPHHSKITSTLQGEAPELRWFTAAAAEELRSRGRALDFTEDVWPLIAKELLWGYYRELFTGHPERVGVGWSQFAAVFSRLDPRAAVLAGAEGPRPDAAQGYAVPALGPDAARVLADARALAALVADTVPDEIDRLFLPDLDRPLAGARFADAGAVQEAVRACIRDDLALRTRQEHSATVGLFLAVLRSHVLLADLAASAEWTPRSRIEDLHGWWRGWFSFLASGPPAHRLDDLLALSAAGVVDFLGPGIRVVASEEEGRFVASSPAADRVVAADALVDARLPEVGVATSDDPLLRALLASGEAVEDVVDRGDALVSTGRLRVHQDDALLCSIRGDRTGRRYAIGPYTDAPFVGAFARPQTNAVSFREHDRVARALLRRLRGLGHGDPQPGATSCRSPAARGRRPAG
ncbi:adenylate cyclase [Rathayibacter tritici]|uniref:FAD/NAD(P)-binding protein n=1 Tax=Rathayibacter tritici TaxID=33888 RepID=UPI000CE8F636|nr:FAD/NAD(P)-binding protein [Rathayibacter tritici]PPF22952.1 adenylate cyclase [Rathayibacter tritici]PPI18159.1 adenylate cyclase [Rathayibacter tritici]